ncbi:MAG: hypothetical protein ACLFR7_01510 [Opitutales bacterium]
MRRVVLPELLDSLPEDDPGALANRRDLRRLNQWMGNFRWLRRALAAHRRPGEGVVEWAAGDGSLGRYLERRGREGDDLRVTGVDLWSRPAHWPVGWDWWQGDLCEWSGYDEHPVVLGNLILHQFEAPVLTRLGAALDRQARLLVFNETARTPFAALLSRQLGLFGAHPVSRHDAQVSVRGGFRGEELPLLLGLRPDRWEWRIHTTVLGAYRLLAWRREEGA